MKISVKKGVYILEINTHFNIVTATVYLVYNKYTLPCVMTSAADGEHMKGSYHYEGLAWDFRAKAIPLYFRVYKELRQRLKAISPYYDLVFKTEKYNEHIHIEFDLRRYQKESKNGVTVLDIKLNEKEVLKKMKSATTQWLIKLAALLLGVLLKQVTKKFRDELTEWVRKKYKESLETPNPFDDMFFKMLADMLDIDVSDITGDEE